MAEVLRGANRVTLFRFSPSASTGWRSMASESTTRHLPPAGRRRAGPQPFDDADVHSHARQRMPRAASRAVRSAAGSPGRREQFTELQWRAPPEQPVPPHRRHLRPRRTRPATPRTTRQGETAARESPSLFPIDLLGKRCGPPAECAGWSARPLRGNDSPVVGMSTLVMSSTPPADARGVRSGLLSRAGQAAHTSHVPLLSLFRHQAIRWTHATAPGRPTHS